MTNEAEQPEDLSAMMEALWGSRSDEPFQGIVPQPLGRDAPADAGGDDVPPDVPDTERDGRLDPVEADALRSELTSAVTAVDAKFSERLDALVAETAQVAAAAAGATTPVGADGAADSARLDDAMRERVDRLTEVVEPELAGIRVELAALRSDIEARLVTPAHPAEAEPDVQAEMAEQRRVMSDEVARQVAEQVAGAAGELQRRVEVVAAQLTEQLAQAIAGVEARAAEAEAAARHQQEEQGDDAAPVTREDFEAFQSELRAALSDQMAAARTELQRSVGLLDTAIADARAQLAERLDQMAALVSQEAARAAEWATTQSAADVAPIQADVRALRARVEEISATVAVFQERPPRF
ncbi:MAG: hypothetical protein ACR2KK_17035 [Acidimicrobiales bacterium]